MRQLIHADDFRAYAIRPYSSLGEMWNSFFHIRNLKVNVKIKRKGGVSHYEIGNASLILVSSVNSELFCLGCYYFAAFTVTDRVLVTPNTSTNSNLRVIDSVVPILLGN